MGDVVIGPQLTEGPPLGLASMHGRRPSRRRAGDGAVDQRLILFCMLFRREALEQIGGLDTRFWRWGFEDDDLSYRLAGRAGHSRSPATASWHLGSRTAPREDDYDASFRRLPASPTSGGPGLVYGDPIPTGYIWVPTGTPRPTGCPTDGRVCPPRSPTLLQWTAA